MEEKTTTLTEEEKIKANRSRRERGREKNHIQY